MKINKKALELIRGLITGDTLHTEYKSGPKLVAFFNNIGFQDVYESPFPSRWQYVQQNLEVMNENDYIEKAIEQLLAPINFVSNKLEFDKLLNLVNQYLDFDNFKVILEGKKVRVVPMNTKFSEVDNLQKINNQYIHEQINKCNKKVEESDYSGAITNARALIEHLLEFMYHEISGSELQAIELPKKYKEVSKLLNLAPENHSGDEIKQILSGFFSIITGFSCFRNDWSDSHARKYNPEKHHAVLAVNSALTVCEFLFSSYEYQLKQGEKLQQLV